MEIIKLLFVCSIITNAYFISKELKRITCEKRLTTQLEGFRYLELLDKHNLMAELILMDRETKYRLLEVILNTHPTDNSLRVAINLLELIEQDNHEPLTI